MSMSVTEKAVLKPHRRLRFTSILSGNTYRPTSRKSIGKYGCMRFRYLKEYRKGLYTSLFLTEKLYPHLLEIDEAANERMDILMLQLMKVAGVTEGLKAADQMKWVGLANNCKAQAEEIILHELIYN